MFATFAFTLLGSALNPFLDATDALGLSIGTDAACLVDFNRDGWTDLVAGGFVWQNEQGNRFTKIAQVGQVVAADYDNDGYPDLFSYTRQQLFHNDKGKAFTAIELPAEFETLSRGACWGDWNGDGFVDLYVGGYEDWKTQTTYPSFILQNERGAAFRIVRKAARFRTRGVTACDYDGDGDLDIYASNYRLQPNQLWKNDGGGRFTDVAATTGTVATSDEFKGGHSIGSAWGDFDNDGLFDLFAGNFAHVDNRGDQPKSRFYKNLGRQGRYSFEDKGPGGVFYQESYATPAAADFDNDGKLDLLFTTVYAKASFARPNYPVLFRNEGEFKFSNATAATGLAQLPPTYQAAWADFNRDGRLDVVCAGKLFLNQNPPANWLMARVEGDGTVIDRSAIGTQVRIKLGPSTLSRQVEAGTGEGNQNDLVLHFGLGNHKTPVDLEILWRDGKRTSKRQVKPNQMILIKR
jgi:hypothetical protein